MPVVCCVCNTVKTNNGWRPLPVRAEDRPSHGFCPGCHRQLLSTIMARASKASPATVTA